MTPNRRLEQSPSNRPLELDNGLLIDGRPGADQRSIHKDRSAVPVQCSVGLACPAVRPVVLDLEAAKEPGQLAVTLPRIFVQVR